MSKPYSRRHLLARLAPIAQDHLLDDAHRNFVQRVPRRPVERGEPVRVGVVGYGNMGGGHVDGLLRAREDGASNLEVAAICDVNANRREACGAMLRERQPGVRVTEHLDHREMYARDDLHAILIATPEHWHATHAVHALEFGKDVYLEKPMTLELEESYWLLHAASRANDAIVQIGTQWLMHPKFEQARRLVEQGALGTVVSSIVAFGRNSKEGEWLYPIDETLEPGERLDWERWCGPLGLQPWDRDVYHRWRRYRKYSTGILGDILSHLIAPMLYAIDEGLPVRCTAHGAHMVDFAMENHDQVVGNVEFESGHVLTALGSTCNDRGAPWMIRGNRAELLLGRSDARLVPQSAWNEFEDETEKFTLPFDDIQQDLRVDWIRAVRTRRANRSGVELGFQHMVVVELMSRAARTGRTWRFDPITGRMFPE